ncbi:MAG: CRTAC1 family protein [Pirellulaceae bacterium]
MSVAWFVTAEYSAVAAETKLHFVDVSAESGIGFHHSDGSSGRYYIIEYVASGLALFDYDNDGDVDIYFLNGAKLPGNTQSSLPTNALYRNDGNWKFTDVTQLAGVGDAGHGLGVTAADYDGDGHRDLYINNFGANVLYHNNGDGTFSNLTAAAGVGNGKRVGAGTSFFDADRDGDLDLYVSNYIQFDFTKHTTRRRNGFTTYASPLDFPPDPDSLFRNNGDGTFTDISKESGVGKPAGYGMGLVCSDYDNDGDVDLLVGNDTGANFLFVNDGTGHFSEDGLLAGFAYDGAGGIQGTMGVECEDVDADGWFDVHVTSYQSEIATLYHNVRGSFEDVTSQSGVGQGTLVPVTWGNVLADFDNDGDRDLFIACGHIYDNVDKFDSEGAYATRNLLFENQGGGRFVNVSDQAGPGLQSAFSSRGAAVDDLDNDGDLDIVVLNSRGRPTILRNECTGGHHWLSLRLHGKPPNRDAVGARIVVTTNQRQYGEKRNGRGYQSYFGDRLHFGLKDQQRVESVEVLWPELRNKPRQIQLLRDVPVDRVFDVQQ